jgi:phospholipase/lecithinase/hemolysin
VRRWSPRADLRCYAGVRLFDALRLRDSLSDAGNIFNLSGDTLPAPPYYNGHFSNGLTWVEDLSLKLGLGTLTPSSKGGNDWAYGGAQTGPQIPGITPALVSLDAEVAGYLGLHHTADPNALYTLSIGGNDIFQASDALDAGKIGPGDLSAVVATAVTNTISEVTTLANAGMKTLVFYELPDAVSHRSSTPSRPSLRTPPMRCRRLSTWACWTVLRRSS